MSAVLLSIPCLNCGGTMVRTEEFTENRVQFDIYQCPNEECARKVCVIFEPAGGLEPEEVPFLQREVARRGAFFPSDAGRGGGFGHLD